MNRRRSRPRRRARRWQRGADGTAPRVPLLVLALGASLGILGSSACATPQARTQPPGGAAAAFGGSPMQPAFLALQAALEEGEDELARALIARLRSQRLEPREEDLVAGAERVLVGRALIASLEFALESEPVADSPAGSYRLFLVARSRASASVCLALPPCDLKRSRSSMDARGFEGLEYESRASNALADLVLLPGSEQRVELLSYELPLGRALAVRERWRLEPRSGEIEQDGVTYPAARVKVAGCARERVSPLIEPEPVAPEFLCARLEASEPLAARELLDLALRIPEDERAAALTALTPVVARLAAERPERVQSFEPALRWLSENRDIGPDAQGWARYLEARASSAAEPRAAQGGLDLPDPRASR